MVKFEYVMRVLGKIANDYFVMNHCLPCVNILSFDGDEVCLSKYICMHVRVNLKNKQIFRIPTLAGDIFQFGQQFSRIT